MRRLLWALPILALAAFGHAAKPVKEIVLLVNDPTTSRVGPVMVHVIPYWGENSDSDAIVVSGAFSKKLVSLLLRLFPPKTRTRALTLAEFTAEYVEKDKDPFVVTVRGELKWHPAVLVSLRRQGPSQ